MTARVAAYSSPAATADLPNRGQAESSVDGQTREHVQHHARFGRGVELEPRVGNRPDHLARRSSLPRRVEEIVGGLVVARRTVKGDPLPGVDVVMAWREVTQSGERVRRTALPEVDLEGEHIPSGRRRRGTAVDQHS